MILGLFAFLLGISIILIFLGIFNRQHSGYALVGFGLLFILSIIIQGGNLQLEKGANVTTTYTYSGTQVIGSDEDISYFYEDWDDNYSHQFGFWLAIISAFGFFFMLYSIKKGGTNEI